MPLSRSRLLLVAGVLSIALVAVHALSPEMDRSYRVMARDICVGGHAMLKNVPCKIVDIKGKDQLKLTGKDILFIGKDIFTGNTYEHKCRASDQIEVPSVISEYMVMDVDETSGFINLMDEHGDTKEDMDIPVGGVLEKINRFMKSDDTCTVWALSSCGRERIIDAKPLPITPHAK